MIPKYMSVLCLLPNAFCFLYVVLIIQVLLCKKFGLVEKNLANSNELDRGESKFMLGNNHEHLFEFI